MKRKTPFPPKPPPCNLIRKRASFGVLGRFAFKNLRRRCVPEHLPLKTCADSIPALAFTKLAQTVPEHLPLKTCADSIPAFAFKNLRRRCFILPSLLCKSATLYHSPSPAWHRPNSIPNKTRLKAGFFLYQILLRMTRCYRFFSSSAKNSVAFCWKNRSLTPSV